MTAEVFEIKCHNFEVKDTDGIKKLKNYTEKKSVVGCFKSTYFELMC